MNERIFVVIAGPAYGHANPQKAFRSRLDAKDYEEQLTGFDWTDTVEVPLVKVKGV